MIILVILISVLLRFVNLGSTPSGLSVDEAAIGYNAYSILETGKDEYGQSFPVLIKSFGDYKAPVYTYLLVPVYKLWGMNVFTTRSISAAAGVITVLFLYLLIKLLTGNQRLALLSSLLLALSPWHIMMSRSTIESNLALMFMLVGLWAFYKYIKGAKVFLLAAAAATALAITTYHSERLVLPLLFLVLGWQYRKTIFRRDHLGWLAGSLIIGLIIMTPTLQVLGTPAFSGRAKSVSLLSLRTENLWGYLWSQNLLNNRPLLLARQTTALYSAYFSPKFLFGPDNSRMRHLYPDLGPLLIWQLPFLLAGAVILIKSKKDRLKQLVILLLVISPLPAALSDEPFGMIRVLPLVVPMSILIALGLNAFLKRSQLLGVLVLLALVILSLGRIYLSVFKLNDYYRYQDWDYGVDQIVKEINKLPDKIVQVDGWRGETYIQLLFFTQFDPVKYQADNQDTDPAEYYHPKSISQVKQIGRIIVKTINWNRDVVDDRVIVGSFNVLNDDLIKRYCLTEVFRIIAPDNKKLYIGARTNPQVLAKFNQLTQDTKDRSQDCWAYVQKWP